MTCENCQKIRQEIERIKSAPMYDGYGVVEQALDDVIAFLDGNPQIYPGMPSR